MMVIASCRRVLPFQDGCSYICIVVAGFIWLLMDLLCVGYCWPVLDSSGIVWCFNSDAAIWLWA